MKNKRETIFGAQTAARAKKLLRHKLENAFCIGIRLDHADCCVHAVVATEPDDMRGYCFDAIIWAPGIRRTAEEVSVARAALAKDGIEIGRYA